MNKSKKKRNHITFPASQILKRPDAFHFGKKMVCTKKETEKKDDHDLYVLSVSLGVVSWKGIVDYILWGHVETEAQSQ